jgi:hypothetical protein
MVSTTLNQGFFSRMVVVVGPKPDVVIKDIKFKTLA